MYEFCINYARTLWNVDKDLLDLLIYAGICWSASTSTCFYLFVSFGVCAFSSQLGNRAQRSGAKRSEAALTYVVFQVWEQVFQSRVRLLLITCWKVWGSLWVVSYVLLSISSIKRASRSHAETGLCWPFLDTFSGLFFRCFSGRQLFAVFLIFVCPWGPK